MRISDWSSDVCSSDLTNVLFYGDNLDILRRYLPDASVDLIYLDPLLTSNRDKSVGLNDGKAWERSEERRVGKEGVSTCRYRWSPEHEKKKKKKHKNKNKKIDEGKCK